MNKIRKKKKKIISMPFYSIYYRDRIYLHTIYFIKVYIFWAIVIKFLQKLYKKNKWENGSNYMLEYLEQ